MKTALVLIAAAMTLAAQPKKLINAKVDTKSASAGLENALKPLLTVQPQPAWIGYIVPASRGRQFGCDSNWNDNGFMVAGGTVYLEPPTEVLVLLRVDENKIGRIRTMAPGCEIDASGATLHWLTDVRPADSVAYLSTFVNAPDRMLDSAMNAIGMHADPSADTALERFVSASQPENVREKAAFWLGITRSQRGFDALKKILANDPSDRVRDRAIQALSISKQPGSLDLVIEVARKDRSSRVRGQALSWLARQAGSKAIPPIQQAIENDPERDVRRRAVSALQQMPNGEGVPLLIEVAKNSHDADVRKQAMNSLGQSRDQRAVAFFEDVLKK